MLGIGTYKLELHGSRTLLLHDIFYALEVRQNLLSVVCLLKLDFTFNFCNTGCDIYLGIDFYSCSFFIDGFIILDIIHSYNNNNAIFYMTNANDVDFVVWHARLGHIRQNRMNRLARNDLLGQLAKINLPTCEYCSVEKSTRKPFGIATRATIPL